MERGDGEARGLDPVAARQRLVEIRCGFAELAEREALAAEARAADVRRRMDAQLAVVAEVQAAADRTASRAAKEDAHRAFRAAVIGARNRSGVEAAAQGWLREINRINGRLKATHNRLRRERETLERLLAERDRQQAVAEAARSMADTAREACLAAQRTPAATPAEPPAPAAMAAPTVQAGPFPPQQAASPASVVSYPAEVVSASPAPLPAPQASEGQSFSIAAEMAVAAADDSSWANSDPRTVSAGSADTLHVDLRATPPQLIVRLVNRDIWTLNWLVEQLAGGNLNARSAWKMRISAFVDATIAAAIDDACFEFPAGHAFWSLFSVEHAREIARGLAALGYRYDGFGAFVDDRVPDQRALALAVGSAGLLPARVHYWPRAAETRGLYAGIRVAADAFLATRAPSLTLGQLLVVLGRRAEQIADLLNEWGRVRPLLLSNPTE